MRIEPTHNLITGLDPREQQSIRPDAAKDKSTPPPTAQGDRIDISLKSTLSIANNIVEFDNPSVEAQLAPERVAEIQNKIKSGFYSTDHVLGQASDGILDLYSGQ